jgi:Zn-finger nucleic acid-binding protein
MNCPICNVTLAISEKQGIEIDYCPKCRGVWLDRGELDKIIERSASEVQSPYFGNNQSYRKPHYDNDHYKQHRPKNWLSDLFD